MDCIRYSNLLESKAYLFRYEVSPTDLMVMIAIELFLPKVHSWLWDNSSFLLAEDRDLAVWHTEAAGHQPAIRC